jgi:hypothetical protein
LNYRRIYFNLIKKRKNNPPKNCYSEKHHIIPKSLGGKDFKNNIIILSAREHFIAHLLLSKMFSDKLRKAKMIMAFTMMLVSSKNQKRKISSRYFQYLRESFSASMSILQTGKLNSQFGKIWITNGSIDKKIYKTEPIDDGWMRGRKNKTQNKNLLKKTKLKLEKTRENELYYTRLYEIYCTGGWKEVVKVYKYSKPNFVSQCKKYVKTFKPQNGKIRGN